MGQSQSTTHNGERTSSSISTAALLAASSTGHSFHSSKTPYHQSPLTASIGSPAPTPAHAPPVTLAPAPTPTPTKHPIHTGASSTTSASTSASTHDIYTCKLVSRKHPTLILSTPSDVQTAHHTTFAYFDLPRACILSDYDAFVVVCETPVEYAVPGVPRRVSTTFATSALRFNGCTVSRGVPYVQFCTLTGDTGGAGNASATSPPGRLLLRTRRTPKDDSLLHGYRGGTVVDHETTPVPASRWTQVSRSWVVVWERIGV